MAFTRRLWKLFGALLLVGLFLMTYFTVDQNEMAVVTRYGGENRAPGLLGRGPLLGPRAGRPLLDLAAVHAKEHLRILRQNGAAETVIKASTDELDAMEKEIPERQTTYLLNGANKPVMEKVRAALELGDQHVLDLDDADHRLRLGVRGLT